MKRFLNQLILLKWNIYVVAISDLTFYVFSYLIEKKNLKNNEAQGNF